MKLVHNLIGEVKMLVNSISKLVILLIFSLLIFLVFSIFISIFIEDAGITFLVGVFLVELLITILLSHKALQTNKSHIIVIIILYLLHVIFYILSSFAANSFSNSIILSSFAPNSILNSINEIEFVCLFISIVFLRLLGGVLGGTMGGLWVIIIDFLVDINTLGTSGIGIINIIDIIIDTSDISIIGTSGVQAIIILSIYILLFLLFLRWYIKTNNKKIKLSQKKLTSRNIVGYLVCRVIIILPFFFLLMVS